MMTDFHIALTPIDKFYFGGDMTFPVGNEKNDAFNTKFSSYIIESTYFPQQTSLLGMLRFLLLSNSRYFSNGRIIDKDGAAGLIGEQSFMVNEDGHRPNDYGPVLKNISTCRLQTLDETGRWNDLNVIPFDDRLNITFDACRSGNINGFPRKIPWNSGYNPKTTGIVHGFRPVGEKQPVINMEDIFEKDTHLGINRNIKTGKTEDNALYKQVCYRFRKNYRFGFCVKINEAALSQLMPDIKNFKDFDGQIVSVGGDGSRFVLSIEPATDGSATSWPNESDIRAIVLTSPSYLDAEDAAIASFTITEIVPFRFIRTNVRTTKVYDIVHDRNSRSVLYQLYSAGSVFYFESSQDSAEFRKRLEAKNEFRQIGYNQYILK